ncbi:hypothetical protein SAMN05216548_108155 [Faunimonas pinastri]|uniref:Uncharacterized protein n=1 Tax=Faunimonas pinastri TaxID=1855383 RepID=A0A1H9JJY7_9HYPH|nr:hypothetical protein [Faunimonas pinastri]SEQ87146.1 hypothetical protein SAMN05216548_108155 [Faunimonas pinastri]
MVPMMNKTDQIAADAATEALSLPAALQLKLALEAADTGQQSWTQIVRGAARSLDAEVVFTLPETSQGDEVRAHAVLRMNAGEGVLLCASRTGGAIMVREEGEIDAPLLAFARASIAVMEKLSADRALLAPLRDSIYAPRRPSQPRRQQS